MAIGLSTKGDADVAHAGVTGLHAERQTHPTISILIPIYNEQENIPILFAHLFQVLDRLPYSFEIVAVNDGSSDASLPELRKVAAKRAELKIIDFRRNYGQTAALMAAIDSTLR